MPRQPRTPKARKLRLAADRRKHARDREKLIADMGGVCVLSDSSCAGRLEFDHVNPAAKGFVAARVSSHRRVRRYRRDWEAGNLQLLCRSHNARKGKVYGWEARIREEEETDFYRQQQREAYEARPREPHPREAAGQRASKAVPF